MILIEAIVEIVIEVGDDATRNGDGHTEDVDQDVNLVLEEISNGNEQVIL
jgi:hypothetical protein